jgi:kynurenine formamidase
MFDGKIIDLSQEIYQGMPVYPGHLKTVIWTPYVPRGVPATAGNRLLL